MARPKKKISPGTVDDPEAAAALIDAAAGEEPGASTGPQVRAELFDEQEALDQLRADAGNGAYVRIKRRSLGEGEFSVLGKMDLSEFSLDRVQEIYGGGEYEIRCFAIKEGKHHTVRVQRFTISHAIPSKHPLSGKPADAAPAPAGTDLVELAKVLQKAGGSGEGGMTAVLTALIQGQSQIMQAMLTKKEPAADTGVTTVLMEMLKMERERSREKTPLSELMDTFSVFKKISGGGKDTDDEEEDIWDKASRLLTPIVGGLAEKYLGGEPPPPGPRVVREIGPTNGTEAGPGAAADELPAQVVVGGDGQPSGVTRPVAVQPRVSAMNPFVKAKIQQLRAATLVAAQRNVPPAEFAIELLDEIPPRYYENIHEMAGAADWFEQLAGADPTAVQHKAWIEKLRDALLAELKAAE